MAMRFVKPLPDSTDLIQVGIGGRWFLTLRLYRESGWGHRPLSLRQTTVIGRHAFDFGYISIVVEDYP